MDYRLRTIARMISGLIFCLASASAVALNGYLLSGLAIPGGMVTGTALMDFKPYRFDAERFYLDSYPFCIGFGYSPPQWLSGRLTAEVELALTPLHLSRIGQIISDASTDYTKATHISLQSLECRGSATAWDRSTHRFVPFGGLACRQTAMVVFAEGYSPERINRTGIVLFGGLDLKIPRQKKSVFESFLRLELRYAPFLKISTVPGMTQLMAGFRIGMR